MPRERTTVRPAYGRVRDASIYSGAGERTVRDWLADGLPHIRVRGGNILIKFDELDAWLSQWRTSGDRTCAIIDSLFEEVVN